MALTNYINQTRRLLHDANAQTYTDTELTDDINQARNWIGMESGSVRTLYPFQLVNGTEFYPFTGCVNSVTITAAGTGYTAAPTVSFTGGGGTGVSATAAISSGTVSAITITNVGSGFTSAPTVSFSGGGGSAVTATASVLTNVLDIINITVNWGNSWITLLYTYFTEFQAKARYYRSVTGQPVCWTQGPAPSTTGGRYFYIFQIPSSDFSSEIDCVITPNALIDDTTAEQLSYPYTECIQYYAAYLAKYKEQQFDEANTYLRIYDEMMTRGRANKTQRRMPNPYG